MINKGIELLNALKRKRQKNLSVIDVYGKLVIPGLIDIHMHGGFGWDASNEIPTEEVLIKLASRGTTSFLPTSVSTGGRKSMLTVIRAYQRFFNEKHRGARALGLHMEGPF